MAWEAVTCELCGRRANRCSIPRLMSIEQPDGEVVRVYVRLCRAVARCRWEAAERVVRGTIQRRGKRSA